MDERALISADSSPVREPSHRSRRAFRVWGNERGTAVVEFALVAPLLFLLVFGIIDFGRALAYYNNLTQLASQGARAAAVDANPDGTGTPTSSSIQSQLATLYTTPGELRRSATPGGNLTICILSPGPSSVGAPVSVKTTYRMTLVPFIGQTLGITNITLHAESTERAEVVPIDTSSGNVALGYTPGTDQNGAACTA